MVYNFGTRSDNRNPLMQVSVDGQIVGEVISAWKQAEMPGTHRQGCLCYFREDPKIRLCRT
jgi:hypothetical protein